MGRRRSAASSSAVKAMATGFATWTTLSIRVPQLIGGTMTPREARRMVLEKVAAATEGAINGGLVAHRLARRRKGIPTPALVMSDLAAIAEAMAAPARKTVKANALRLAFTPRQGRR